MLLQVSVHKKITKKETLGERVHRQLFLKAVKGQLFKGIVINHNPANLCQFQENFKCIQEAENLYHMLKKLAKRKGLKGQ